MMANSSVSSVSNGGSSYVSSISGVSNVSGISHGGNGRGSSNSYGSSSDSSNRGDSGGDMVGDSRDMSHSMFNMSPFNGDRVGHSLVEGGGEVLRHLLDSVGAGLVDKGLADGLVSPDGSVDLLGSEGGDVLEDRLGSEVGPDNGVRLVGGNRCGDVGVGGLCHGMGQDGDLRADLSKGMGLSGGVGEVSTKPVVLYRGTVMSGGPLESGSTITLEGDLLGEGHGGAHEGEVQEGVHGSC